MALSMDMRTTIFGVIAVTLAFSMLAYARSVLEGAKREAQAVTEETSQMLQRQEAAEKQNRNDAAADRILALAKSAGLSSKEWNERRINIQANTMPRGDVNALLADLANSPRQIFGADQFDIAVKDAAHGLFDAPSEKNAGVVVTLKGLALFRAGEVPQ